MVTSEISIRKIGNSLGLILSRNILEAMNVPRPGAKVFVSVDDEGTATMKAVGKDGAFKGPFAGLAKYAPLWGDGDKSAVEMAEELKSGRINKTFEIW